jgi:pseudouridine synthase
VGRLDKDSEGLIILTNDGEFANLLTHPKFEHEKEYAVLASYRKGTPREELLKKLEKMESGVMIEDKKTSPAKITLIKASNLIEFNIVIHEGRKRQIRQMCSSVGFNVERLTRIRIGKLELGELKSGKYRSISREEVV